MQSITIRTINEGGEGGLAKEIVADSEVNLSVDIPLFYFFGVTLLLQHHAFNFFVFFRRKTRPHRPGGPEETGPRQDGSPKLCLPPSPTIWTRCPPLLLLAGQGS